MTAQLRKSVLLFLTLVTVSGCGNEYIPPAENSLVLKTEVSIRDKFGIPDKEWEGSYGAESTSEYEGKIKTLVFAQPGGELYLLFEQRGDDWIVIHNSWLPDGFVF